MEEKYAILADYLSDHLWMRNSLDYDFLKTFPEFLYQGTGYRVLFTESSFELKSFTNQSFAKTLEGAREFIDNTENYDKDVALGRDIFIYECSIEGFDVNKALAFMKSNAGLTEQTIKCFIDEEEVIAFSYSIIKRIE